MTNKYNLILDNTSCDFNPMWRFLEIRKEKPFAFNNSIQKLSFFYMFPYSIWSITNNRDHYISFENVTADINKLEDFCCDIYLEFENINLEEKYFKDRYSNMVLDVIKDKPFNAVVFNNELANYIKNKCPKAKLIQSAVKNKVAIEPPFDMNVIGYNYYKYNKSDIVPNKQSYIISVNSFCYNTHMCADYLSQNKLDYEADKPNLCMNRMGTFSEMKKNALFVSLEEMDNLCAEGFDTFLVKTNCDNIYEKMETYLYYTVKPEYRDSIRLELIKSI